MCVLETGLQIVPALSIVLAKKKLGRGKYEGADALDHQTYSKPTGFVTLPTEVADEKDGNDDGDLEDNDDDGSPGAGKIVLSFDGGQD